MNMTDELRAEIIARFGADMLKQIEARYEALHEQAKAYADSGVRFKSAAPASDFWGFPVSGHSEDDRRAVAEYHAANSRIDRFWLFPASTVQPGSQNAKKGRSRAKFDTFWLIPVAAQSKTLPMGNKTSPIGERMSPMGDKMKSMPWAENYTPQPTPRPPAQKSVGMALKSLSHDDKILVRKSLSAVFGSQRSTALITEYWDSPDGLAAIVSLLERV